jgi:hypothetical protein
VAPQKKSMGLPQVLITSVQVKLCSILCPICPFAFNCIILSLELKRAAEEVILNLNMSGRKADLGPVRSTEKIVNLTCQLQFEIEIGGGCSVKLADLVSKIATWFYQVGYRV